MEASKVSKLLAQQLSFYGDRSKVIASNIANIDTPGYKTKDIVQFDDTINQIAQNQQKLHMISTNDKHMRAQAVSSPQTYSKVIVENLQEDQTGNNVDLDKQMADHAKNNIAFSATKQALKKDNQLMKSVIEASVKLN